MTDQEQQAVTDLMLRMSEKQKIEAAIFMVYIANTRDHTGLLPSEVKVGEGVLAQVRELAGICP